MDRLSVSLTNGVPSNVPCDGVRPAVTFTDTDHTLRYLLWP